MTDGENRVTPGANSMANSAGATRALYQMPMFWLALLAVAVLGGAAGYALHSSGAAKSAPSTSTSAASTTTTSGTTTTTAPTGCLADQSKIYVEITVVNAQTDGTTSLAGHPVTLHCGGPDDRQYIPQLTSVNITLLSNASITILDQNFMPVAATLAQRAYVTSINSADTLLLAEGVLANKNYTINALGIKSRVRVSTSTFGPHSNGNVPFAAAINSSGAILFQSLLSGRSIYGGFLLRKEDGKQLKIPNLSGPKAGFNSTNGLLTALNDCNVVAGVTYDNQTFSSRGLVWSRPTGTITLNSKNISGLKSGVVIDNIKGLNNSGQVLAMHKGKALIISPTGSLLRCN